MKLIEAVTDIATQLGDANLDSLSARGQDHFVRAINELMKADLDSDNPTFSFYPAYHRVEQLVDFSSSNLFNIVTLDVNRILNIYPDPATAKVAYVLLKDVSEVTKMAYNEQLQPSNEEIVVYRIGNDLRAIVSATDPTFDVSSDKLFMDYIREVNDDLWKQTASSGTDLNDNRGTLLTSGTLVVGEVYELEDFITGDDFSNVGATNIDNFFFVATAVTPTTWTQSSKVRRQKLFSNEFTNRCIARAVETLKSEDEESQ